MGSSLATYQQTLFISSASQSQRGQNNLGEPLLSVAMTQSIPSHTTVLIVGAGPVGLTLAVALLEQGMKDFVIIDQLKEAQNSSRAFAVHAATMEVSRNHVAFYIPLQRYSDPCRDTMLNADVHRL